MKTIFSLFSLTKRLHHTFFPSRPSFSSLSTNGVEEQETCEDKKNSKMIDSLKSLKWDSKEVENYFKSMGETSYFNLIAPGPPAKLFEKFKHYNLLTSFEKEMKGIPLRSIVILLGSRLLGIPLTLAAASTRTKREIEKQQFHLSLASELMYASLRLHGLIEENSCGWSGGNEAKGLVLLGDLLITEIYKNLREIENNKVTEMMSETFAELASRHFIPSHQPFQNSEFHSDLLYEIAFKSSAILGAHPLMKQRVFYDLGSQLGAFSKQHEKLELEEMKRKLEKFGCSNGPLGQILTTLLNLEKTEVEGIVHFS